MFECPAQHVHLKTGSRSDFHTGETSPSARVSLSFLVEGESSSKLESHECMVLRASACHAHRVIISERIDL